MFSPVCGEKERKPASRKANNKLDQELVQASGTLSHTVTSKGHRGQDFNVASWLWDVEIYCL